jgi:Icc protein
MLTPSLRVAQITDTHLFADASETMLGVATVKSLQAVVAALKTIQPAPDLVLMTGDLSQDETSASYDRLQKLMITLGIPAYWLPGNHDIPATMQDILCTPPVSAEKSFPAGGWNFILLNSVVSQQVEGTLSVETLVWLNQQLRSLPNHPTLIALHHPPLPIGSPWMDRIGLKNPQSLFDVIDCYPQVKLVVFGHVHQAFEGQRQGVHYLATPSTCVQFKPQSAEMKIDELNPGFRLITLYADGQFETDVKRVSY